MKNSWRHYLRRLAATAVVGGSVAWSSAVCYAAQLAFDSPDDPTYADGWAEGDDGGFGFGPWNFDGTSVDLNYNSANDSHVVDDGLKAGTSTSSPFNDIGKAWTIYNFNGRSRPPHVTPTGASDIARAGRRFAPLQVGQNVIVDNPVQRFNFRGYFVRLNGGGGNICYAGAPCTPGTSPVGKFGIGTFDYFTYGQWFMTDVPGINSDPPGPGVPLFDADGPTEVGTDSGMRLDFTLTGTDTFEATMTPLDNPAAAFTHSGPLDSPGVPIDWIEFTFFNTDSDFHPTMVSGALATDFYIRSIEITNDLPDITTPGDYNDDGTVDAADYVAWRKGAPLANDPSLGTGPDDYDTWVENFGPASGGSGGSAVPEAGTFVLAIVGSSLMTFAFRQRRRPDRD